MTDNQLWSERFKIAADDWVDKEAAAQMLEDTKSSVMAEHQSYLGDIPVNKAEQTVKASRDWKEYVEKTVVARRDANKAKMELEYIRMKFQEWSSNEANHRAASRL